MSAKRPEIAHKLFCVCVIWAGVVTGAHAAAKEELQLTPIQTPRDVYAIPLRKPADPHQPSGEQWAQAGDLRVVRNVTQATITPVLPDVGKANGAAVIIAPGGAYYLLSIDKEGYSVARWLAQHGIVGIVLKYRTEATPVDDAAFQAALKRRLSQVRSTGAKTFPGETLAAEDVLDALRVARSRAGDMNVDPKRIGVLGFSAGAVGAIKAALDQDTASRPLFVASIYGPLDTRAVSKGAPPLFVAHALDDKVFRSGDLALVKAWQQAGNAVELHLFERGGHGFGGVEQGASSDHWLEEFYWWLSARGVLNPSTAP